MMPDEAFLANAEFGHLTLASIAIYDNMLQFSVYFYYFF